MMTTQILLSLLLGSLVLSSALKDPANMSKQESQTITSPQGKEVVTLGGGCFWCIEAVFEELHGVEQVACLEVWNTRVVANTTSASLIPRREVCVYAHTME